MSQRQDEKKTVFVKFVNSLCLQFKNKNKLQATVFSTNQELKI